MFPITCLVKYSIYFVTDGKYPFISDEDNQQIRQHRQDESNTSFIKVREN